VLEQDICAVIHKVVQKESGEVLYVLFSIAFSAANENRFGVPICTAANQKLGLFGVAPVVQPSGAGQQAVTLGNVENAIGGD